MAINQEQFQILVEGFDASGRSVFGITNQDECVCSKCAEKLHADSLISLEDLTGIEYGSNLNPCGVFCSHCYKDLSDHSKSQSKR